MSQHAHLLMRGRIFALTTVMCLWGMQAMAADGLMTIRSSHGPKDTMDRLEAEVRAKGLTVFARIDGRSGWTVAAADRASSLWQCQRRHAADAVNSIDRNRSTAESAGLARRSGQYLAFVQRSELARETARAGGRG